MISSNIPIRKLLWVLLFGITFAFVEASIVVYLRAVYYPEGFTWPLKVISSEHLRVEVIREAATIVMLAAVGIIAGNRGWQRFGYFLIAFGIWDIFYYVWLKATLDWPASLTDWDVLFLIPLPWIGPVIAPVLIAMLMTVCGFDIVARTSDQKYFRPGMVSWILSLVATAILLYSFMSDTAATLHGKLPQPYSYTQLIIGLLLYIVAYWSARTPRAKSLRGG